ncbi:hypothetical protein [Lignipirellula cremea]|uniref:Uncharacterized protein n=1 Tax=Lignipirellula cremea TaxID=2528010 RepID=A0A518DPB3_9BACT|nr:hypothetical protein [Lignipirellula cremea]QDU93675.1 hypothetical protein Pla8534_14560 [Lignipirellula cremea]
MSLRIVLIRTFIGGFFTVVALASQAQEGIVPLGPGHLPQRLQGNWQVGLCVLDGHSWLRFHNLETHETHTLSRIQRGWGGRQDEQSGRWIVPHVNASGLHWNQDLLRYQDQPERTYLLRTVNVANPVIFRGQGDEGYGLFANNCVTFVRDAWDFYAGEYFRLLPPHLPQRLRSVVIATPAPHPYQPPQRTQRTAVQPAGYGAPLLQR